TSTWGLNPSTCYILSPTGTWGLNPSACLSRTPQVAGRHFRIPVPTSHAGAGGQFQPLLHMISSMYLEPNPNTGSLRTLCKPGDKEEYRQFGSVSAVLCTLSVIVIKLLNGKVCRKGSLQKRSGDDGEMHLLMLLLIGMLSILL